MQIHRRHIFQTSSKLWISSETLYGNSTWRQLNGELFNEKRNDNDLSSIERFIGNQHHRKFFKSSFIYSYFSAHWGGYPEPATFTRVLALTLFYAGTRVRAQP